MPASKLPLLKDKGMSKDDFQNYVKANDAYSQEVLGFSDDFLREESIFPLALEDDPTLPEVDHSYYDSEGDILLLEAFLNDDPSLPPPT
ncbi:hypothetical protein Tco_0217861 [Tanacetum coccineum]